MSRLLLLPLAAAVALVRPAAGVDPAVLAAEKARVAAIAKVRPAVVAVCIYGGQAIGSGVVIDPAGYALTNFHVTEPCGPVMQGGLADGNLYEAVIVGQDKVGDVALIKLLPKKDGTPFPYVKLGDSDAVKAGDWSLAMGNPFSLAMDFTPTVTYGLVSGVNRYQPPEGGGTLEYTDCIQIETSINPGNSGGPLFNMNGELIGINGRGSFDKRGRVNSGVGYAISVNQIKNFLGHFYAGIDTDHATLGALVQTASEEGVLSQMAVKQILEESDAFRRGLRIDDTIVSFAGRPLTSTNQYKNILGIYPKDWRLPLVYRRETKKSETLVRLMGLMDVQPEQPMQPRPQRPGGPPQDDPKDKAKKSPAAKLFKEKKGFANAYFNEQRRGELLAGFRKHADLTGRSGAFTAAGAYDANERKGPMALRIADTAEGGTDAKLTLSVDYEIKGLPAAEARDAQVPEGSGGLLAALYHYRRLLTLGPKGFEGECSHGGTEPFYPLPPDGKPVESWAKLRVDCDVLRTKHGPIVCKWYFAQADKKLIGCEAFVLPDDDPCELTFSDHRPTAAGQTLPHRIDVRYGDKRFGFLTFTTFEFQK